MFGERRHYLVLFRSCRLRLKIPSLRKTTAMSPLPAQLGYASVASAAGSGVAAPATMTVAFVHHLDFAAAGDSAHTGNGFLQVGRSAFRTCGAGRTPVIRNEKIEMIATPAANEIVNWHYKTLICTGRLQAGCPAFIIRFFRHPRPQSMMKRSKSSKNCHPGRGDTTGTARINAASPRTA